MSPLVIGLIGVGILALGMTFAMRGTNKRSRASGSGGSDPGYIPYDSGASTWAPTASDSDAAPADADNCGDGSDSSSGWGSDLGGSDGCSSDGGGGDGGGGGGGGGGD